ncbi:MAG TPA: CaiB/BaiF CoA-transferase family protein [Burkholderiaceae bacterium]|nr:CaiB/BaiF CoA-transferase family protein [Burkholderiaceae bacterium]
MSGPLTGLRVIELASIGPGPMCAMLLADQGADVTRVDRVEPSGLGVPLDPRHDVTGRGRRSIALDLKHPVGRDAVLRLIDRTDVLIEGWRPGVAERLGLGPDDCAARNPRLVYGRMTGYGQSGPLAQAAGHDINYIALTGALHAIGPAGGAPVPPLNLIGDYGGGALYLAFGLMAALYERERSGRGQVVDAAMVDGASSLLSIFHGMLAARRWDDSRRGANLLDGGAPFYGTYATSDGRHVALGALEPKFFRAFCQAAGRPDLAERQFDDGGRGPRDELEAIFASRTRDEWERFGAEHDVCVAPVLEGEEPARDPQLRARGMFLSVDTPWEGKAMASLRTPVRLLGADPALRPAPRLGEHTRDVLAEAGFAEAEVASLQAAGVI